MENSTLDPSKFKPIDIERRKQNIDRRRQDEFEAMDCVMVAQKAYNCALIPSMNEGKFEMLIQSRDEASPETDKKIEAFSQYVQQVCADYQVEFMPVLNEDNPQASGVYLLTTW